MRLDSGFIPSPTGTFRLMGYKQNMEIAIFPIPNTVAYPGQTIPLHVFEPRYRQMVQDCVNANRMLGVCQVKRILKRAPKTTSLEKDLDLYEPASILSFGTVRLMETFHDGRMLIYVSMKMRGQISTIRQEAPYYLAEVTELQDERIDDPVREVILRAELAARFEFLWRASNENNRNEKLPFDPMSVSFSELSFLTLSHLWIDPVFAQTLLEERNPHRRASILMDILRSIESKAN